MPWAATDKKTIWSLLNLPRDLLCSGSALSKAMEDAEQFDLENQTDLIGDAQEIFERLEELKLLIREERLIQKTKKVDSYLEGAAEYFSGDDRLQAIIDERNELVQQLRRIINYDSLFGCFGIGDLIESS